MFTVNVSEGFLKWHESPRQVMADLPNVGFRYDQTYAFIQAIKGSQPEPIATFQEGSQCQAVVDAVLESAQARYWVDVK